MTRKPQLADALANVQAAEAAQSKKPAATCSERRSPFPTTACCCARRRVDIGQYVTPGTQLGVSFAVDTAEIRSAVGGRPTSPILDLPPSTDRQKLKTTLQVSLSAEIRRYDTKTWAAHLIRTEGVLDESSRVLYVQSPVWSTPMDCWVKVSQDELRMGTFVRAAIDGRYVDDVVVLPRYVLRNDNTVLVANGERELEVREVDGGARRGPPGVLSPKWCR